MPVDPQRRLTTPDQIADVLGTPPDFVVAKLGDHVDAPAAEFIGRAPLAFVATHDRNGRVDVSPKGDAPGFVHVDDDTTLLIPERKGNNLADGMHNILDTGRIGMIFVVPGERETLRVNGSAVVTDDPQLMSRLAAHDKPSLLGTVVDVEECFFHCGKSMIRSRVWLPESWPTAVDSPMVQQTVTAMGGGSELVPVIAAALEQNYIDDLY